MRVKRRHSGRIAGGQRTASASRNRLPARIALRYVRVVARGIGAVVPVLRGAGLAGAVVAVVRIVIRSIWIVSPSEPITPPPTVTPVALAVVPVVAVTVAETIVEAREATMPSAAMKSAKSTVKRAGVKAAVMEATAAVKTAAMEATAAVKTAAPAMRAGMGEVRLAERCSEQQNSFAARPRILPTLVRTRCSFNSCMDHSFEPSGDRDRRTRLRGLPADHRGVAAHRSRQIISGKIR